MAGISFLYPLARPCAPTADSCLFSSPQRSVRCGNSLLNQAILSMPVCRITQSSTPDPEGPSGRGEAPPARG